MVQNKPFKYNSLEDFLVTKELTVDAELDDGLGAKYAVKGREIEATILFADISQFTKKTLDLSPTAMLIYINRFFTWITNEALKGIPCIIDKYIGDQVMIIFSNEFGSSDHFMEAVNAARWFAERDILGFQPHMGLASGLVTVGYVGTILKYNCSVFGMPVVLASRCAATKLKMPNLGSIIFPTRQERSGEIEDLIKSAPQGDNVNFMGDEGYVWKEQPASKIYMKHIGAIEVTSFAKVPDTPNETIHDSDKIFRRAYYTRQEAEKDLAQLHRDTKYRPITTDLPNQN